VHGCAHVSSCCVCCGGVWCHGATGRFRDLVDQDLDWIQKPSTGLERRKYKHSLEGLADNLDVGDTEPIMLDTGVITRQRNLQHNKLRYLFGEIAVDLGPSRYRTLQFWSTLMLLFVMCWLSIYSHGLGQWLWLTSVKVPVTELTATRYSVEMTYTTDNMSVAILIGPYYPPFPQKTSLKTLNQHQNKLIFQRILNKLC